MLYPLRFRPLFRHYLWGGRRLETVLGKTIESASPDQPCAESWEIADHGDDQSIVAQGPLAGRSLGQLAEQFDADLLGQAPISGNSSARFPLLFKFLDAQRNLSVQVHPSDEQAAKLDPPDLGKTEAWVILDALPGSVVYAGIKRGFDRPAFEREVRRGTVELCLHRVQPQAGDCFFIPAGTVHALGAGLLVAEIQQASDTTFRLFDWNRTDAQGNPRPLHIDQALDVIDYQRGPVSPQTPQPVEVAESSLGLRVARLVDCSKFVLDRWTWEKPTGQATGQATGQSTGRSTGRSTGQRVPLGGDGCFHLVAVLAGEVLLDGDPSDEPLQKGETILIPASVATTVTISAPTTLLAMRIP